MISQANSTSELALILLGKLMTELRNMINAYTENQHRRQGMRIRELMFCRSVS